MQIRTDLSGGIKIAFAVDGGENDTVTFEAFESTESRLLFDDELWKSETLGDNDGMQCVDLLVQSSPLTLAYLELKRAYRSSLHIQ